MSWLDMSGFEKFTIPSQVCKNKTEQAFSIIGRTGTVYEALPASRAGAA